MNIVHVTSNFSLSYGGMSTACKEIAEAQSKVGGDVTVVTSNLNQFKIKNFFEWVKIIILHKILKSPTHFYDTAVILKRI